MRWRKKRNRYRVEGDIEVAGFGETTIDIHSPVTFTTKPDFSFSGGAIVLVSRWLTQRRRIIGAKLVIVTEGDAMVTWRLDGWGYQK